MMINVADEEDPEPKPGEGCEFNPAVQGQHRRLLVQEKLRSRLWHGQCLFALPAPLSLTSFTPNDISSFSSSSSFSRTSASSPLTTRPASWSSTPMVPPPRTTPSSGDQTWMSTGSSTPPPPTTCPSSRWKWNSSTTGQWLLKISPNFGFLRDLREYDITAYPGVILRLKLERMLTYYRWLSVVTSG